MTEIGAPTRFPECPRGASGADRPSSSAEGGRGARDGFRGDIDRKRLPPFVHFLLVIVVLCVPSQRMDAERVSVRLDAEGFTTRDGLTFGVTRHADPRSEGIRAVAVGVHGISGAASDFDPLGAELARRGIALIAWNQRSQGLDPRPARRGDLEDWRLLVRDCGDFVRLARREAGDRPVFVCAESMGALIAINAAARGEMDGVSGLVLLSPVVDLRGGKPPAWMRALIQGLLIVAPWYRLDPSTLAPKDGPPIRIAGDLAYQEERDRAPHRIRKYTFRFFRNLIALTESARASAEDLDLPVLVLFAGRDIFVHPEAIEEFYGRIASRDKSSRQWPDAYHLLLFDSETDQVLETIGDWMDARIEDR